MNTDNSKTQNVPDNQGCLCILIERGVPADFSKGEIGARKPDRWRCFVWGLGQVMTCPEIRSDLIGRPPTLMELLLHMDGNLSRWTEWAPASQNPQLPL